MKKIKNLFFVALLSLTFVGISNAQLKIDRKINNTPEKAATSIVTQLDGIVGMTAPQRKKVNVLALKFEKSRAEILADKSLSERDQKEKLKGLTKESLASFTQTCTEAQKAKWNEYLDSQNKDKK